MTLYDIIRPFIFKLDAERAHSLTITLLKRLPMPAHDVDGALASRVAGIDFPSPVGLAAGFDKDAEVPNAMLRLGFGSVEIGTVTPLPQSGNAKPRLFRLVEDAAVINRMGFNNAGQTSAHARLRQPHKGIIGVNIGANKDAADRVADYVAGVARMSDVADYLTINISSPNTPGLRALQDKAALTDLLGAINSVRTPKTPPIFLKVAPDLEPADIDDISQLAIDQSMDALIVSNTTVSRPALRSKYASESGGLSGAPLRTLAVQRLDDFRRATGGAIPLISAGGISTADDAYARIRAGASLVQLYSALVYHGPGLVRSINQGLAERLRADGFAHITEVIGAA